jgi:hypothetical protein
MGMSTTPVSPQEDVTHRLQALSDLLKAAATDDNVHLKKETERCKRVVEKDLPEEIPETTQEWDDDIVALTKQLMECRQDTPEQMEFDDVQPARVTYQPERKSRRPKEEKKKAKTVREEEPQDKREQLQRQMSEMSYPKIGPGYSDTISVMSDLSIPTVVTNLYVPEEEYYKDLPPPAVIPAGMIPKRQPSIGSNMMEAPPDREDESTFMAPSLIAPSIVPAPSIVDPSVAAPSIAAPSLAPEQPHVSPAKKTPGGAAAQRRQTHQAVLAHLQQQQLVVSTTPPVQRRSCMVPGKISKPAYSNHATLTVNDLPPLNFPNDEPSEYGLRKPNPGKRRNLLSRGNKYAASVTATSTRMLLSSSQKKTSTPTKRSSLLHRGNKKEDSAGSSSPNSHVDIDGVLSTMNGDIDFIFQELSVLEADHSAKPTATTATSNPFDNNDASNIGSTAKIKYTLTSVARTLRPKDKKKDVLAKPQKEEMSWGSLDRQSMDSISDANTSDPLLIDEDGFIVTDCGHDGGFSDLFAPTNNINDPFAAVAAKSKKDENPFADSFFPPENAAAVKRGTKKKTKKKTSSVPAVDATRDFVHSPGDNSTKTKESRIDAVELATKKRIEMLRKLVEYRARQLNEGSNRTNSDGDELEKLDFVEAETMKQIARLRNKLGASRRELGQE